MRAANRTPLLATKSQLLRWGVRTLPSVWPPFVRNGLPRDARPLVEQRDRTWDHTARVLPRATYAAGERLSPDGTGGKREHRHREQAPPQRTTPHPAFLQIEASAEQRKDVGGEYDAD